MRRRLALIIFVFPLLLSFYGDKSGSPRDEIVKLYQEADRLYNFNNSTDSTYSLSLSYFETLIGKLEQSKPNPEYDSLLFHAYLKKAVLLDVVKTKYAEASQSYCKAISIQKSAKTRISDSLLFRALNYAGACYYNLNNFDSANYFLLQAQQLLKRFPAMPEKERLYNTLGVLYYVNGNYVQSKNYFNQALEILHGEKPFDKGSVVSIQANIATSLFRLGQYKQALTIYEKILQYHVFANYIYMNMGRANSAMSNYQEALTCYRKVKSAEVPGVLNEMGYAQLQMKRYDSSMYFLDALKRSGSNKLNELDIGVNELYRGDLMADRQDLSSALIYLQKAIGIFSGQFNDTIISSNPKTFTGTLAYFWLFEALYKKATVFEARFQHQHSEDDLIQSHSAYSSVLSLLAYIEKSYDTDDAKLFLKKKSFQVYQKALDLCLVLNQLHPGDHWLEEAFLISEKNKASVVAASVQQKNIGTLSGIGDGWLQEERNIKYNIARLNINSDQSQDSRSIEMNTREKSKYEIALAELQKKIEQNNHYYKIKYQDDYPGIPALQQRLTPKQAMISFYVETSNLHAFVLTSTEFKYVRIDSFATIQPMIEKWLSLLKTPENGRKFSGAKTGQLLYQKLISPIQSAISDKDEWIIIPDGILCFLPFESLPADTHNRLLLETTAISYQFSSRFMVDQGPAARVEEGPNKVLAFAPFVHRKSGPGDLMGEQLPASGEEISGLHGIKFEDSFATKSRFLQEINKYPIVHLATHAVSDIHNSAASYIAFYPQRNIRSEDCLYLEELYGLNMDATRLMIISACETGKGELVSNEGVMSIARAFTYAGCSSVINSLWKADDNATSAILKQFHVYLQHGFTKSKALQLAKLDYIKGNSIHRSPEYWSHLILIGNTEPLYTANLTHRWAIVIFGSICTLVIGIFNWRMRRKEK
jgi:CHAT domain-containing protein/Flp pilus assembly protein TadD